MDHVAQSTDAEQSAAPGEVEIQSTGARAVIVLLGCVLAAVIAVGVQISAGSQVIRRDLLVKEEVPPSLVRGDGLVNPPGLSYGLDDPARGSDGTVTRWTMEHATLNFPFAANMGHNVEFFIRLAGKREPGQTPAAVKISINSRPVLTFTADNTYAVYDMSLDTAQAPGPYLHPADVQVDIESTTIRAPGNTQHGVAVEWAELRLDRSRTEVIVETAVWCVFAALVLLAASLRLGLLWGATYSASMLVAFALLHFTYVPRAIPLSTEIGLAGLAWTVASVVVPKRHPWVGLALVAMGLWLVVGGRLLQDWEVDDAYISYRYAWNLVHGNGLVYNPGEIVEGYTNFLWTIMSAGGLLLGLAPGGVSLAATITCSILLLGLTYMLGERLTGGHERWALLGAGLLAVDAGFVTYGPKGSGLETMAFALFVLLPVALLWGDGENEYRWWWRAFGGLTLALAVLTRPEGLMVAAVLLVLRAWQDRRAGRGVRRLLMWALLPFLVIVVPYEVWRIAFYGYPVPNTFYAKTGTSIEQLARGAEYALDFADKHWLVVLASLMGIAFAAIAWFRNRGRDRPQAGAAAGTHGLYWALAALVIAFTLYVVAAGGDWAIGGRFFVPLAAPMALLTQEMVRAAWRWFAERPPLSRAASTVLAVVVGGYVGFALWLQLPDGELSTRTVRDTYKFQKWSLAGLWLRDNTPAGTLMAATPAGGFAYYSERPVVDMYGLNDLHIGHLKVEHMGTKQAGHEKSDPAYVLDRKPDYIMKYDQQIGYFEPVAARLAAEYDLITARTATGYPTVFLKRKGTP